VCNRQILRTCRSLLKDCDVTQSITCRARANRAGHSSSLDDLGSRRDDDTMSPHAYVALGDGITSGSGATEPETAYTALVGQHLQTSGLVDSSTVLGRSLWTARHLLRACTSSHNPVTQDVQVVSLLIGGNDLRRRYYSVLFHPDKDAIIHKAIKQYAVDLNHLCAHLQSFAIPKRLLLTQYNPFPHSPLAVYAISQLNAVIATMGERYEWTVVDLETPFADRQPELIAGYRTGDLQDLSMPFRRPLYPNDQGHQTIAEAICTYI
jgi:lysophospholipase L1-like esterase